VQRRSVYCTASFLVCSLRSTKLPIIYPDLRLDYKVATHSAWEADRDVYDILVGSSSQDIRLHKTLVNLFTSLLSVLDSKPVPVQSED
jgi:hypothetical protein